MVQGLSLEDNRIWLQAVQEASKTYQQLPDTVKADLDLIFDEIMLFKSGLLELTQSVGATVCAECGGVCCNNGKYHISVLDLMAFIYTSEDPPTPDFANSPFCPYGSPGGCLMLPGFRPVTCLIFNCELIENKLNQQELVRLRELEQLIREKVNQAEKLLGLRVSRPLLLCLDKV
jgi:hypothetical protein